MTDPTPLNPDDLPEQLRKHLVSLRAAGVEWLPNISLPEIVLLEPAPVPTPAEPTALEPVAAGNTDLFPVPIAPELSVEQRRRELELIAEQVSTCPRCPELLATRKQTVFGDGCLDPEICFVGEAPGAEEDNQGIPFVGAAGHLLNRIINGCGFKREQVYICNILKCRPPGNRLPLATEAAHCREYLEKQLELVRPRYIVALGACAAQNLLGTTSGIGKLRGRFHDYQGVPVLCTYHPAYLLRSPEKKRDVWEDLKMLLTRMGRPIPVPKKAADG
jgi:DNA polymerase